MDQGWEVQFARWAQSPSGSETQRLEGALREVREAIRADSKLAQRTIDVFTQGSYRNRTNVRQDSDVDVGVLCRDTFFFDIPPGTTRETFGIIPASYDYAVFKNEVEEALVAYFGRAAVVRGSKAFDIKEARTHVEADVAPFFEHRRYRTDSDYQDGVELRPDSGVPSRVINWPEQHYKNGNAKNDHTNRSYRALVRILKNLRNDMEESRVAAASPIIGFLVECLVYNVPDEHFRHDTYGDDLRAALSFLYQQTKTDADCREWGEVSELKYLFGAHQRWSRQQANDFIAAAWKYVGFQ